MPESHDLESGQVSYHTKFYLTLSAICLFAALVLRILSGRK